jgi:hypothetical protein
MYISLEKSDFHRPCSLSSLSPPGIPLQLQSHLQIVDYAYQTELDPRQQRPEFLSQFHDIENN